MEFRRIPNGGIAAALLTLTALSLAACSDSGSDSGEFPTKDITLIEPFAAGGGGDAYSRALAECFGHDTPDGIDIIVENRTPAIDGISQTWNAEPDGYTIGSTSLPTIVGMKLSQPDAVPWDPEGFIPLGIAESNGYVVYVKGDSPYQSIEDLQNAKGLKSMLTQPGGGGSITNGVLIVTFGLDATQVYGAEASAESALAVLRGEADFITWGASDFPDMVESGELRPILFMGTDDQRTDQYPWLKDLPGMDDVGHPELAGAVSEYRMWSIPPETPAEAVTYLQDLFKNAFDSGCMEEWSAESKRPLLPNTAEEAIEIQKKQTEILTDLYPQLEGIESM